MGIRGRGIFYLAAGLLLSACTYEQEGPPSLHFTHFKAVAPQNDTVTVCSAYGCQHQTLFTFTARDIRKMGILMEESHRENTPEAERKALAKTIAWIEKRVGGVTGTERDRAGLDLLGSGDRRQQDCVDEATNTTSYMMVMERHGMLRHHKVLRPMAKGNMIMGIWPHWGAMIEERATGRKFAVDSFFHANGEPPVIMAAERWYIDEGGTSTPMVAKAQPMAVPPPGQILARGKLDALLEQMAARPPEGARPAAFGYGK
ncbi:MAG: hypothetical protein Kow0032_01490 [Methyloligellaceae bacterium]